MTLSSAIIFLCLGLILPFIHGFFVLPVPRSTVSRTSAGSLAQSSSIGNRSFLTQTSDSSDIDLGDTDNILPSGPVANAEKAWRHVKKPLLSIGSKGASPTHGNSLRQLLESHTAVKVKINNSNFASTVQSTCQQLLDFAIQSGAPSGIEVIQARTSERIVLFGMPGTIDKIARGEFPPPPPPEYVKQS